jgi:hypothetical protein
MNQCDDLIDRILNISSISIKTRTFVENVRDKLDKFGTLTGPQIQTLRSIANQVGISLTGSSTGSPQTTKQPLVIEEIKGSCGICHNGLVNAKSGAVHVFKCPCEVGMKRIERFPTWAQHLTALFEIDRPIQNWNDVTPTNTIWLNAFRDRMGLK